MTKRLTNVPQNPVAFRAMDEATKNDSENVVFPSVKELLRKTDILNYLRPFLPILPN